MSKNKICNTCGKELPKTSEYFHYMNIKKGYFNPSCKQCRHDIRKARRENNPEKYADDRKRRRIANIETYRETEKKYYYNNIEKCQTKGKKYREKNVEKARANFTLWNNRNKERRAIYSAQWRKENPEKMSISNKKKRSTPHGKLNHRMGSNILLALKGSKNGRGWESLVGYTCSDLKKHLEKQFGDGMSWENMGDWHIDHKIPISVFNFTSPEHEDFKRCWSLKNLQPMWAQDNLSKGASLEKPFQPSLPI